MPLFNAAQFNAALFGGPGAVPSGLFTVQVGQGLLYPALRKAAITLGPGRTPSPAQFQDAIDELNRLISSLNCDRLFIYSIDNAQYPLDPVKASYTIGQPADPTQPVDFNVPRPQLIESANIIDAQMSYRLGLATDLTWSAISFKTLPNSIPSLLYNDRAFPVSTLYLWGQPSPGQLLELYTWHQVPNFMDIADVAMMPMQYVDALTLNLAVRLVSHFPIAPNVPRQVDPNLYQQAQLSLMRLESINAPQPVLDVGSLCRGSTGSGTSYNILSDTYSGSTMGSNKK